jgi:ABC-2 type transport system ATP-binding protein
VVILDEPASALDPIGRAEVLDLMRDLKGQTTVFYSTHIIGDVERVSDHVAILHQGRLTACEPTDALLKRFTNGTLRVRLRGAADVRSSLEMVPGVVVATAVPGDAGVWTYEVVTEAGVLHAVQQAITRLAAEQQLALLTNDEVRHDLETVFLRLVANPN